MKNAKAKVRVRALSLANMIVSLMKQGFWSGGCPLCNLGRGRIHEEFCGVGKYLDARAALTKASRKKGKSK